MKRFLGLGKGKQGPLVFGGVAATGITLEDLYADEPRTAGRKKVIDATRRLLKGSDINVICMGGVILAGLEDWVREACVLELGAEKGHCVRIVEQLRAGIITLECLVRIGC